MRIRFERMNYETEYYHDAIKNKGFLITDKPFSDLDKTIRNVGGPRSPLYGTTYGDNAEFADRYRCKCGAYIGAIFEGNVCPECNTNIEYHDVDIMFTGYLNFYPFKIIHPLWFHSLQGAIGRKNLEDIIANDNIITSSGVIRRYQDDIEVKKTTLKYHNIGVKEFYDNYEEIMGYFKTKRKQKADAIEYLIKHKRDVWTSKIPVYTTSLRPMGLTPESYYFSPIN